MEDLDFISLYEELDDGTIDDIAGNGYWHLEKMKEGVFSLVVMGECDEKRVLWLKEQDGDIKVEVSK